MKAYKFLVLFFLLNACGSVLAEEIYFSCSTKSGIAVLQMNDNNLEYSFDKKGRTIFLFKSKKSIMVVSSIIIILDFRRIILMFHSLIMTINIWSLVIMRMDNKAKV